MCWSSSTGFDRAMRISWNIRQSRSWKSLVFQCGPLNTLEMSFSVCLIPCLSLPITKAPSAAPKIVMSSCGIEWRMIPILPPASV